mmetsp:Transcript_8910/g.10185  ORF Transcript_8910/g.10185 Transcript_8910/m.10185 type:complete len:356 (+) Transcript_8910:187-1254(+)
MLTKLVYLLFVGVAVLGQGYGAKSSGRELLVGGQAAGAGQYEYFATLTRPLDEGVTMFAGALIHPRVVIFGVSPDLVNITDEIVDFDVTIGREGSTETRNLTEVRIRTVVDFDSFAGAYRYGIGLLGAASTKTPVTLDDGSFNLASGTAVSIIGKGLDSFKNITEEPNFLDDPLNEIQVSLLSKSECIGVWNETHMLQELLLGYFDNLFNGNLPPGLADSAVAANAANAAAQSDYIDTVENLVQSDEILCLRNLSPGKGMCQGDLGAPVIARNQNIMVGLHLRGYEGDGVICHFGEEAEVAPITFTFMSAIYDQVIADIEAMVPPEPEDDSPANTLLPGMLMVLVSASATFFQLL